jgi:hypothetical protein
MKGVKKTLRKPIHLLSKKGHDGKKPQLALSDAVIRSKRTPPEVIARSGRHVFVTENKLNCLARTIREYFFMLISQKDETLNHIHPMKITKKQAGFISNILVSLIMTAVMTTGMMLIHSGWFEGFMKAWIKDFAIACCLGIPTGLLVVPVTRKWVDGIKD